MSMSTYVIGFKPADETWKQMKAVWNSCFAAGISIPKEVSKYFNDEPPGDKPGIEVDLENTPAFKECGDESQNGYEIDITKVPEGVRYIRFYNSW